MSVRSTALAAAAGLALVASGASAQLDVDGRPGGFLEQELFRCGFIATKIRPLDDHEGRDIFDGQCPPGAFCNDGLCQCAENLVACAEPGSTTLTFCSDPNAEIDTVPCANRVEGGGGGGGDGDGPVFEWPTDPSDESDSTGDPHFKTWDGLRYDFQGIGAFRQCQTDTWQVSTCQEPWVRNPTSATVNRAVRISSGSDVFTVNYNAASGEFDTDLNGSPLTESTQTDSMEVVFTSRGARVIMGEDSVRLSFSTSSQWISVYTSVGSGAATSGLCGTNDGDSSNDFTRPDGSVIALPNEWFSINGAAAEFGESWREAGGSFASDVACGAPTDFPDFQSYDILTNAIGRGGIVIEDEPRLQGAERARHMRAMATSANDLVATSLNAAIQCLADASADDGFTTASINQILDTPAFGASGQQAAEAVRAWQILYDLVFFGASPDADMPIDLADCASGNPVLEDFGVVAPVQPPPTGETFEAFCDGSSRCKAASIQSSGTSAAITWSAGGDDNCERA